MRNTAFSVDGYEGGGWYAGITYTAADGMMPGSGGPSTTDLEESCFAIEPVRTSEPTTPVPKAAPAPTGNGRHKNNKHEAATARARDLAPRARGTDASIPSGRAGTDACADAD